MSNIPGVENPADLDRIYIEFKDKDNMAGESVWAERLRVGERPQTGVYEIKNIPYFASGFTLGDKVLCDESSTERIPDIIEMVERQGYISVAILFGPEIEEQAQAEVLDRIITLGALTERSSSSFVVVAVTDAIFQDGVEEILDVAHQQHLLDYQVTYPDEREINAS